jgi:hypothetical protein
MRENLLYMRKATREVTIVALIIAAIAVATGTARLVGHKLEYPQGRVSADVGRH